MIERFETITTQVAKISRNICRIKNEEMSNFNLKGLYVSCLYYLYKNNSPMTAKDLCDVCDEDKAAVSRSLAMLENEGYISCESKSEKRYKSPIVLTEKGKEVAEDVSKKIDEMVDLAGVGITEEDRVIFYRCLATISDNLQKICDNYGENKWV